MTATDEAGLLAKRQWVREHLAIAFRFWGKMGYGEGIRYVSFYLYERGMLMI